MGVPNLLKCGSLTDLGCSRPIELENLQPLLVQHESLKSINVCFHLRANVNVQFCGLLLLLEHNESIESIEVRFIGDEDDATLTQLRRTLVANTHLKRLDLLDWDWGLYLSVIADVIGSNGCSLESLKIARFKLKAAEFLRAVCRNTTLKRLSLNFFSDRDGGISEEAWSLLLEMIRSNCTLQELSLTFGRPEKQLNLDSFAQALGANFSLTTVTIDASLIVETKLKIVTRLYTRRNRVRQMVKEKKMQDMHWPVVLEYLATDLNAIFLVLPYVPLPTR